MKSIIYSLLFILGLGSTSFAQAPEAIKYQAAVRDADGKRIVNMPVGVQISIIKDSADGTAVYTETFNTTTSTSGVMNIEIGNGTPSSGTFAGIKWGEGSYFVELSLDVAGGTAYKVIGSTQLVSVPYSLYANTTQGSQVISKADRATMTETVTGTLIYCSDCGTNGELQIYNGTEWTNMIGGPVVE